MSGLKEKRLGFIGVGAMGGRMARNLLKAGYRVMVCDLRAEAVSACVAAGATAGADPDDVVRASDVVMTCLVSPDYILVAEKSLAPNARAGQIFIDHSTVPGPETRRLASLLAARGALPLDVPVSGWITGAESGTLSMFIGGDKALADRCMELFLVLGSKDRIVYGGPTGMGQALKVVQQLKRRLLDAARMEIMSYGLRAGLSWDGVLGALQVTPEADDPYAQLYRTITSGQADELSCLFGEWPYYLADAAEKGIPMPILESLYAFCKDGPRVNRDEQGRPGPSVWNELTARTGPALQEKP
jgi:3-hydroxyisobutyrate dehydrogenase-like beta-hydroxyacid dehydrogenase